MKIRNLLKKRKNALHRTSILKDLDFGDKSNEYYLVSFPKSGNTWVRFLIANLLSSEDDIFLEELSGYVPDSQNKKNLQAIQNPDSKFNNLPVKIVKTHDPYMNFYKNKKIIYIVRDGRDVMNSYYHYLNARSEVDIPLIDILKNTMSSPYGTWSEHIDGWMKNAYPNIFLVKYEQLIDNPELVVTSLVEYLQLEMSSVDIKNAIAKSSFKTLQTKEKELGVINENKLVGKKSLFFRRGSVGDWNTLFSQSELDYFIKSNRKCLVKHGYIDD